MPRQIKPIRTLEGVVYPKVSHTSYSAARSSLSFPSGHHCFLAPWLVLGERKIGPYWLKVGKYFSCFILWEVVFVKERLKNVNILWTNCKVLKSGKCFMWTRNCILCEQQKCLDVDLLPTMFKLCDFSRLICLSSSADQKQTEKSISDELNEHRRKKTKTKKKLTRTKRVCYCFQLGFPGMEDENRTTIMLEIAPA